MIHYSVVGQADHLAGESKRLPVGLRRKSSPAPFRAYRQIFDITEHRNHRADSVATPYRPVALAAYAPWIFFHSGPRFSSHKRPLRSFLEYQMGDYLIGGLKFSTKSQAERHIRWILSKYGNGQQLDHPDSGFVTAILDAHPNAATIRGCGIKRVQVQVLSPAIRRFVVVRTDDSIRDFTWRHALYPRSALDSVRRVCRTLIRPQVEQCRARAFAQDIAIECPITGNRITRSDCDIDHTPPDTFAALVDRWLAVLHITAEDVDIVASEGYQVPDRFADVFLADDWVDFHRINAKLRAVHPVANRSILRKRSEEHNGVPQYVP